MDLPSLASKGGLQEMWPFPPAVPVADPGGIGMAGIHPGPAVMTPVCRNSGFPVVGGHQDATSAEESTVTGPCSGGIHCWRRRRELRAAGAGDSQEGSSMGGSTCSGGELTDCKAEHLKTRGLGEENGVSKREVEASLGIGNKLNYQTAQPSDAPKQDYIHVRARRGQATDSHSLADFCQ